MCERAGAPVIRVTVFTFPLRHTGAQAAHGEGEGGSSSLWCMFVSVRACEYVCVRETLGCVCVCVCMRWLGGCAQIIALQSFLDRPNGVLMSQEGFGCCRFPLNRRGIFLSLSLSFSVRRLSRSTTKVFIDYLGPLLNNLILGDSALCSHRN